MGLYSDGVLKEREGRGGSDVRWVLGGLVAVGLFGTLVILDAHRSSPHLVYDMGASASAATCDEDAARDTGEFWWALPVFEPEPG